MEVVTLEWAQCRFTRMVHGIRDNSYKHRLERIIIFLEKGRI